MNTVYMVELFSVPSGASLPLEFVILKTPGVTGTYPAGARPRSIVSLFGGEYAVGTSLGSVIPPRMVRTPA